jgi:hypothetical protein
MKYDPMFETHSIMGVFTEREEAEEVARQHQGGVVVSKGIYTHLVWKEKPCQPQ